MKIIKTYILKLFMLIFAVMCFSGCVVVNYFDLNKFKPADSREILEFDSGEDAVDVMEIKSLNLAEKIVFDFPL